MTSSGPLVPAQRTYGPMPPGIYWRHVSTTISRGYLESINKSPGTRARTVPKKGGPKWGAPKSKKKWKKFSNFFKKSGRFTEEIVLKIEHEKKCRFNEEIVLKIAHFWGIFGKFFVKNGQKRGYFKWRWPPTFQKVKQIYKPTGPMSNLCFPIGPMSISSRDGPVERFSGAKILSDL